MATTTSRQKPKRRLINSDEALRIARLDAEKAYDDLSAYRITIRLERDQWLVDYELTGREIAGGGPHYVIDRVGTIVSKRYEQ